MLNEGLKRCIDCRYYPDDCGYWDKEFRKNNKQLGFLKKNTIHNCQDFSPLCSAVKLLRANI